VYYGRGRDAFDVRGRTAHESLFNAANGTYRGPSTQQGYSPFSTWTRGLAWAMLGFAEELEFLETIDEGELAQLKLSPTGVGRDFSRAEDVGRDFSRADPLYDAAMATCDFYIDHAAAADGVPYWDTGAPGLAALGDWMSRPADPFNAHEPVDASAAAIAAQGLLRFGRIVDRRGGDGGKYEQAGLCVLDSLTDEGGPYLSKSDRHQGLLLHSIYHRPNGWDHVPSGSKIPYGESSMWGDYHLLEAALYVKRLAESQPYYTFFGQPCP
jgi:hypothetical protein